MPSKSIELEHFQSRAGRTAPLQVKAEGLASVRRYGFDDQGRLVLREQDQLRQETIYDPAGRLSAVRTFRAGKHATWQSFTRHYTLLDIFKNCMIFRG